jgi:hypothetical protein
LSETYLPINGGLDLLGIMDYLNTVNQQLEQAITVSRREFLPLTIQVLQKMSHPVKIDQGHRLGSRPLLQSQELCFDLLDLAMVAFLHIRVRGTQIVFEVGQAALELGFLTFSPDLFIVGNQCSILYFIQNCRGMRAQVKALEKLLRQRLINNPMVDVQADGTGAIMVVAIASPFSLRAMT